MRTTSFRQAEAEALATMTPDERARFDDAAGAEEEARLRAGSLRLDSLAYCPRTGSAPDYRYGRRELTPVNRPGFDEGSAPSVSSTPPLNPG